MGDKINHKKLEYFPLSLFKVNPEDMKDQTFELRNHVAKVKMKKVRKGHDLSLPSDCLLSFGKENPPLLMYCVTMYNEPFTQLLQSLAGIYRSYYELWGIDEGFKDRCHIVIIIDGYDKIDEEFLIQWEKAGLYNEFKTKKYRMIETPPGSDKPIHKFRNLNFINEDTMNDKVRIYGTNNIAHWFSRMIRFPEFMNSLSTQESNDFIINNYTVYDFLLGNPTKGKVKTRKYKHLPMPVHFTIKHKNQGKIESHKWFFKGFCEYMNPKYCQIIDCGSIPLWNSISYLIMHMEAIPQVGGACGEIECMLPEKKDDGQGVSFIESVLLRSQYVEYKLSHYLDKSTETLFGFVSVLPGAFSTFRWEWINGSPLDEFLKGAADEFGDLSKIRACAEANKYLAEDRIMCLEIIAKKNCDYIIHYVPGAQCLTDPPLTLTQLIKQRRRWFNGSMFASIHVLKHMCKVWRRKRCSCIRNLFFMLLYLYMTIQMMLSFVIVGSFYGVFNIFLRSFLEYSECFSFKSPANFVINLYVLFLILTIMLSTTIEIHWAEGGFRATSMFMGLFTLIMVASSFFYIADQTLNSLGVVFLLVYLLSFVLPLLLNCRKLKCCDFTKGVIYTIYLSPTYVNIFTIYSISNIHDVTWGSRPSIQDSTLKAVERKKELLYKDFRAKFLIFWALVNIVVGSALIYLFDNGKVQLIFYIGIFLVVVMFFRILFAIIYKFKAKCDRIWVRHKNRKRRSTIFEGVDKEPINDKEDVFVVYYDDEGGNLRWVLSSFVQLYCLTMTNLTYFWL